MNYLKNAYAEYKQKNTDEPNVIIIGKKFVKEIKDSMPMFSMRITSKDSFIMGCLVIETEHDFCFFA
jgi:hypothetical protein